MKRTGKILLVIGILLALAVAGGYWYLYSHGLSGRHVKKQPASAAQTKIACVGDSITYGHGISDWAENNYPQQLQNLLGNDYHVENFGVSGRTVQDTGDQPYRSCPQYQESLSYGADVLIFMMGTNDSKPENWQGRDVFKTALLNILDSYEESEKEIILCTPAEAFFLEKSTPPETSFDIQPEIVDEIARVVEEIAQERGYGLIDIHTLTEKNPSWFAADGVHPSGDGALSIAKKVAEAIS